MTIFGIAIVRTHSLFTWSTIAIYLDQVVMLQAELFAELAVDVTLIQWILFIKDTLNLGHLSVYRTASRIPMVSSIERFHSIQDSQLGSQWCPL